MAVQWYAIRSKPNKEEALWRELEARDVETFYPRIQVNPVNPRSRRIRAYFPGYLFIHVDLEKVGAAPLQFIPHSQGVVTFDSVPPVVPDNLIAALRRRVEEVNAGGGIEFEGLEPGQRVYIHDGPFEGYHAIFDVRLSGSERVRVLIELLNRRQLPLEIQVGQIRPEKARPGSRRK